MSISAPRRSGKSYLTGKLIRKEYDYHEFIYIVSPSLRFNSDYDEFKEPQFSKVKFISDPTKTSIEQMVVESSSVREAVRIHNGRRSPDDEVWYTPRILLVLDDCIDSEVLRFRGVCDRIAERGRHVSMSVIIISQRLSAISRSIRINSDYFIIFAPFSIGELEKFMEEFLPRRTRTETVPLLMKVFATPYHFVLLDNVEKVWYRKLKTSTAEDIVEGRYEFLIDQTQFTDLDDIDEKSID